MHEDLIHDWNTPTEQDRDPRPGPVMLDDDAVETAAGVHAAAGDSSFRHRIRVGPMSGRSNVVHRLPECGIGVTDSRADRMFEAAQRSSRLIEDEEIETLAREG